MELHFIKDLIILADPQDKIKEFLIDFWLYDDEEIEDFINKKELEFAKLEREFFTYYFDYYFTFLAKTGINAQTLREIIHGYERVFIFDALSLREASILKKRLEAKGYEVVMELKAGVLPTDTMKGFREKVLTPKKEEQLDGSEIEHWETEPISLPLWISFPDALLHHQTEDFPRALERTWAVLERLLKFAKEKEILVTSDHGYIYSFADHFLWNDLGKKEKELLALFFGNQRFSEIGDNKIELLERLRENQIVALDKEFSYILGRFIWPMKGKRSNILHGGLSLMEIFVPFLVIRR